MGVAFSRAPDGQTEWRMIQLGSPLWRWTPIGSPVLGNAPWTNDSIGSTDVCEIHVAKDQLFYWPSPTPLNMETTVVYDETHTFTYPTVYIHWNTIWAEEQVTSSGTNVIKQPLGTTYADTIIGYDPQTIYSLKDGHWWSYRDPWLPVTFTDYNRCDNHTWRGPAVETISITGFPAGAATYTTTVVNFALSRTVTNEGEVQNIHNDPCLPYINVPGEIWDLDPSWKSCVAYGIPDPPYALSPALSIPSQTGRGPERPTEPAAVTRESAFTPVPITAHPVTTPNPPAGASQQDDESLSNSPPAAAVTTPRPNLPNGQRPTPSSGSSFNNPSQDHPPSPDSPPIPDLAADQSDAGPDPLVSVLPQDSPSVDNGAGSSNSGENDNDNNDNDINNGNDNGSGSGNGNSDGNDNGDGHDQDSGQLLGQGSSDASNDENSQNGNGDGDGDGDDDNLSSGNNDAPYIPSVVSGVENVASAIIAAMGASPVSRTNSVVHDAGTSSTDDDLSVTRVGSESFAAPSNVNAATSSDSSFTTTDTAPAAGETEAEVTSISDNESETGDRNENGDDDPGVIALGGAAVSQTRLKSWKFRGRMMGLACACCMISSFL